MITINKASYLDAPIKVDPLNGVAFTKEQGAHKFVISCYQNGEKLNLTGTITGKFTCNGRTIEIALDYAGIENGDAWVILSQHCYDYAGRFQLAIFNTVGNTTFCIYACVGNVQSSQIGDPVDGGEIIDTIEDLIEDIQDAIASIPPDYSDLVNHVDIHDSVIYDSENITYLTSDNFPLGFRSGYFTSTGISKASTNYNYSRNAVGIVMNSLYNKVTIIPAEGMKVNYCIFSEVPSFAQDADNSSILLANGGGFKTGERTIYNPPSGLLYVSYNANIADVTESNRPVITIYRDKFSDIYDDIEAINDDILESVSVTYGANTDYPLGFRLGYFTSTGLSKTTSPGPQYSRNAKGILISKKCKSIEISPQDGVQLNYCIFSTEPSFDSEADNSNILLANGGGFTAEKRVISNPPSGMLYVSHKVAMADLTENNRPNITLFNYRYSTTDLNHVLGYTRNYTDVTWQLNFERKQITTDGIIDSTTHVLVKLPNIGSIEVRMNTPAGKFSVYKNTNGTITQLCDYTTYQYRIFADYVSDYYVDITNINVTTLTLANARKYVLVYVYNDVGIIREAEYSNMLYGKKVAFIGDSITQGRYHETGSNEDVDGTNITMAKPYPLLVGEVCGDQSPGNYGIGGALVYDSDWKSLYRNCHNVSGYDVVFIHAGTNDYGNNTPADDFESAYRYVISTLMAQNGKVVVVTPVFRTNRTAKNSQNMYLIDYVNIEKTVAASESCDVIDLYTLTDNNVFKGELSDGLHPNEIGHMIIADLILKSY